MAMKHFDYKAADFKKAFIIFCCLLLLLAYLF
jgi:hypothetical protein